jgi:hypothetical protein
MDNPRTPKYMVWQEDGVIFLIDNCDGCVSVTNAAEMVVQQVLKRFQGPIVYRDTDGHWDELKHNGVEFTGFGPTTLRPKRSL